MVQFFHVLTEAFICFECFYNLYKLFLALKEHVPVDERFFSLRFEAYRSQEFGTAGMFVHYLFMFDDLLKNALVFIIGSVGSMHDQVPFAILPDIHFADGIGKAIRAPPFFDVFRIVIREIQSFLHTGKIARLE